MSLDESFGSMRTVGDESTEQIKSRSGSGSHYSMQTIEWNPPDRYARHLPAGFSIRLGRALGDDGIRRFLPESGDWRALVVNCFIAGMAIRQELGRLPITQHTNARIQFCAFLWMKHRQEYLKRRFQHGRDIHLRMNSRLDPIERDVISQLSGWHQAMSRISSVRGMAEVDDASLGRQFHDGLYRIALKSEIFEVRESETLELAENEIETILRNSFVAHKRPLPEVSQIELEEVNERLHRLMDQQFDLASDEFTEWLTSSRTSLPTRIARQDGQLSVNHATAKAGLFALGWLGMRQASICINATMRTIFRALNNLNECETRIFESLYFSQPALNNFVPMQFLDRHDFLAPALVDIWNGRSADEVMPAVRTLLYIYGRMANTRRSADRVGSVRNRVRNETGSAAAQTRLNEQITSDSEPSVDSRFHQRLIDALHLQCGDCQSDRLLLEPSEDYDPVRITCQCEQCAATTEVDFSLEQLRRLLDPEDFGAVT